MDRDVFRFLVGVLRTLGRRRTSGRMRYTDATILEVYLWVTISRKPVVWACDPRNWPAGLRRGGLPSQSVMSRRLRSKSVRALLARLLKECIRRAFVHHGKESCICIIDGKSITIPMHSADRHAGKGRGVGHVALGYKLHIIVDEHENIIDLRFAPLNVHEREMGRRMVKNLPKHFKFLLGDPNYDSRGFHITTAAEGIQLLAPRCRKGGTIQRKRSSPTRVIAVQALETDAYPELREIYKNRRTIERVFAQLTTITRGTQPPTWIRGFPSTKRFVSTLLCMFLGRKCILRDRRERKIAA
jgi:hypothetical protein